MEHIQNLPMPIAQNQEEAEILAYGRPLTHEERALEAELNKKIDYWKSIDIPVTRHSLDDLQAEEQFYKAYKLARSMGEDHPIIIANRRVLDMFGNDLDNAKPTLIRYLIETTFPTGANLHQVTENLVTWVNAQIPADALEALKRYPRRDELTALLPITLAVLLIAQVLQPEDIPANIDLSIWNVYLNAAYIDQKASGCNKTPLVVSAASQFNKIAPSAFKSVCASTENVKVKYWQLEKDTPIMIYGPIAYKLTPNEFMQHCIKSMEM